MLLFLISFLVTTVLGLLYPIYSTLKLITKKKEGESPDISEYHRWVSYWIVFAFITKLFFCDCENEYFVFLEQVLRSLLIVFLALPQTKGSLLVYDKVLKNGDNVKIRIQELLKMVSDRVSKCCSGCTGAKSSVKGSESEERKE